MPKSSDRVRTPSMDVGMAPGVPEYPHTDDSRCFRFTEAVSILSLAASAFLLKHVFRWRDRRDGF